MKNKFTSKESLLDFLKSSWENGKKMDATNFSSTWDALVKNLKFEDGYRPEVTITDGTDGSHTITITKPDGSTASTVIHDGKNGKDGKDGKDGTQGTQGAKGDKGDKGDVGAPGFSPDVTITDVAGSHTITITKPDGTTARTTIHDGKNGKDGKDGAQGTQGAKGDKGDKGDAGAPGFSPEVTITDGTDGSHTITITKPDGSTASTVIHDGKNGKDGKDGKDGTQGTQGAKGDKGDKGDVGAPGFSPDVTITDVAGSHTITITKPDGTTARTTIHDGKNGKDGKDGAQGTQGAKGDKGDKGDVGAPGFSPDVTITDVAGSHTITITKPDGTTARTTIHDGKNGKDGKDGAQGTQGAKGDKGDKGDAGAPGFSPEVTITDGAGGTHTLTITKPGGSASSTVIKDGKDGKDGTPGISYTHPLDKNSMSLMSYSHTYYPLYQTEDFEASSPFYKFTPDIKVEVNSVAVDAPTSIENELSDGGWTKGLVPTSYVITMLSNHIPNLIPLAGGNFIFNGGEKGDQVEPTTLDVPIDSLKLPTADGTSKSIADIGFISSAPSFDTSPMFFMTYPRPFLIPVRVVEKDSGNQPQIIETNTAIVSIAPDEFSLRNVPVLSHEVNRELIYAKFSPSRKSISELPNVFKYSWTAGTAHIPFNVDLLQWNKTTANFDRHYGIQSDSCKNVEVYPIFNLLAGMPSPSDNEFVKSIVLNSAGREVMKLFIGDPNGLGLINL